jgi:hypothetical protein
MWDFKFSRRRVWSSELSSGMLLPCKVIVDRRFRGTCCLHHQGWVTPLWWRQHIPLKRRATIILHGSTSQKTILNFKVISVHLIWLFLQTHTLSSRSCVPLLQVLSPATCSQTHPLCAFLWRETKSVHKNKTVIITYEAISGSSGHKHKGI